MTGVEWGEPSQAPTRVCDTRDQRSYLAWSTLWILRSRQLVRPGGILCAFSDWRQLPITTDAVQSAGWVWRGVVPWDKIERGRPQMGRYRAQAEYVVRGTNGARPLAGPVAPGVFRVPVTNTKHHISGKPVSLMEGLLQPMAEGASSTRSWAPAPWASPASASACLT